MLSCQMVARLMLASEDGDGAVAADVGDGPFAVASLGGGGDVAGPETVGGHLGGVEPSSAGGAVEDHANGAVAEPITKVAVPVNGPERRTLMEPGGGAPRLPGDHWAAGRTGSGGDGDDGAFGGPMCEVVFNGSTMRSPGWMTWRRAHSYPV